MKNRRASTRHPATEYRIWLGLWTGPDRFEALGARVVNVSSGGARIVLASPPGVGQKVWLTVGTAGCSDCVEGKVLDVVGIDEETYTVRLAFDSPCPRHLLRTISVGMIPSPHFSIPTEELQADLEIERPRELTERTASPIIHRLSSKARTTV